MRHCLSESSMIKSLFFTATLLVPGLAYGGNPSAPLSVQVVPGSDPPTGIACAVGPPIAAIPAAAAAAGFNTCILNMDFSDSTSFTYKGATVAWTSPNTWLDCKGASEPIFSAGTYGNGNGYYNCGDYNIITDTDGKTSLDVTVTQADFVAAGNYYYQTVQQTDTTWMFPMNIYMEYSTRGDTASLASPPTPSGNCCYFVGAPFYGAAINGWKIGGDRDWIEVDPDEWYGGNPSTTYNYFNPWVGGERGPGGTNLGSNWNFGAMTNPCPRPCTTMGQYNTIGIRTTSNTSGNIAVCGYSNINGIGNPTQGGGACQTGNYATGASDVAATNLNYMTFPYIAINGNGSPNSPFTAIPTTLHSIWRRLVIFSCSTWQTTVCANGLVTSNP
jgi:hypothetical protein